jgi:flagellar biosynthesis protein FlhF
MVLVDTPGYNPFVEEQMVELGEMLTELPNRTTYFVAPANLKDGDLNRAAAALGIFGLDGVILTKLDETYTYGSVYNFARKSQLPLGYFSSGKGAEGALQAGTATRLVSSLFGKGWIK